MAGQLVSLAMRIGPLTQPQFPLTRNEVFRGALDLSPPKPLYFERGATPDATRGTMTQAIDETHRLNIELGVLLWYRHERVRGGTFVDTYA